ncbi:MAG: hydroxymethylbilane synthase [Alphaproteobacteria bacterium]|nr:hydroxymethylbilane synthase [Alphaproteobacteria bacterium]
MRIGTRGSPLALLQAEEVRDKLVAAHGLSPDDIEIVVIKTTGDKVQDRPLAEIGGKGLFTKEIEDGLHDGSLHMAVHSMKDMPAELPPGLIIDCLLTREDVRDGFISPHHSSISELPEGAVVGTSSVRRQAQLQRLRPDIKIVPFRGNVQTRLRKLEEGMASATFLACAGLNRLGRSDLITSPISPEEMLPAVAQGAIGVEVRADDSATRDLLKPLNDETTEITVAAERAYLSVLDGSCRTPMAGLAELSGEQLRLRTCVLSMDGARFFETERNGSVGDAAEMGRDAGEDLKAQAGPDIFSA